jgi:6-phosphogluconolactonase/glucosamine-6-phosphate isomerase/deaminase
MKLPHGPDVNIFDDDAKASISMARAVVEVLKTTPVDQTILLATGKTMLEFYPALIRIAKEQAVDLSSFNYGQLDNYVWRPSVYPNGPGKEDFIEYLQKNFLEPANIPKDHFYPMNGITENPEQVAWEYNDWLSNQKIAAVFLGLGPAPEVHLAYIKSGTPLDVSVHHALLSDITVSRNKNRGETAPNEAITVGLANIKQATHKFVLAIGKPEEVRLALTGPITLNVVASALRTEGFKETVHLYLDRQSAMSLSRS